MPDTDTDRTNAVFHESAVVVLQEIRATIGHRIGQTLECTTRDELAEMRKEILEAQRSLLDGLISILRISPHDGGPFVTKAFMGSPLSLEFVYRASGYSGGLIHHAGRDGALGTWSVHT